MYFFSAIQFLLLINKLKDNNKNNNIFAISNLKLTSFVNEQGQERILQSYRII